MELEFILSKTKPRLSGTLRNAANGAPVPGRVVCDITRESPNPPGEMSWSAAFASVNGRFRYDGKDGSALPLLRGDYSAVCHAAGIRGKISSPVNRLRVPEDYSRNVQWIAGSGE